MPLTTFAQRVDALDWAEIGTRLLERGFWRSQPILSESECLELIALYDHDELFRKRINMESHSYGQGDYAYFRDPVPDPVAELRQALYRGLRPVATRMHSALGIEQAYPPTLDAFLEQCHQGGQTRPTPLLLRYVTGGFNRMHRDLYGEIFFPFQATIFLSEPGKDYDGGEFLLQQQRARVQSRIEVLRPARGEMVVFATREYMAVGKRGPIRMQQRHGVATLERGERHALGIIFHDAE